MQVCLNTEMAWEGCREGGDSVRHGGAGAALGHERGWRFCRSAFCCRERCGVARVRRRRACAASFCRAGLGKGAAGVGTPCCLGLACVVLLRAFVSSGPDVPGGRAPRRLLEQVADALRVRHYSPQTVEAYVQWVRRFILFHERRHPAELGRQEVARFLSHLAVEGRVSASTQNQALAALLFLYAEVLETELGGMRGFVRAKRPQRLPVVMSRLEVNGVLARLGGVPRLMASLLYGSGLRLLECVTLRVKDVDFGGGQLSVRRGKGQKDRAALLPQTLVEPLTRHLGLVRRAAAASPARDGSPACGSGSSESGGIVQAGQLSHVPSLVCDALAGSGIRRSYDPEAAGHRDLRTTMVYTHVLSRGPLGVKSPLDAL